MYIVNTPILVAKVMQFKPDHLGGGGKSPEEKQPIRHRGRVLQVSLISISLVMAE